MEFTTSLLELFILLWQCQFERSFRRCGVPIAMIRFVQQELLCDTDIARIRDVMALGLISISETMDLERQMKVNEDGKAADLR